MRNAECGTGSEPRHDGSDKVLDGASKRNARQEIPSFRCCSKDGFAFWYMRPSRLSLRKFSRAPHDSPNFSVAQTKRQGTGKKEIRLPCPRAISSRIWRNVQGCS